MVDESRQWKVVQCAVSYVSSDIKVVNDVNNYVSSV